MLYLLLLSLGRDVLCQSPPGAGQGTPEQVSLTYGTLPSQMVVKWAAFNGPRTNQCVVQWGNSPSSMPNIAVATNEIYNMSNNPRYSGPNIEGVFPPYTSPTLYTAIMTNLPLGNTRIFYRVGCRAAAMALGLAGAGTGGIGGTTFGRFSPVRSFMSHPGVGAQALGGRAMRFHVMGDPGQTRVSNSTFSELMTLESRLASTTSSLCGGIINMGDISYADGDQPKWDSFGRLFGTF